MSQEILKLANIYKKFGNEKEQEVVALDGIDVAIQEQDLIALVGPSGSGKTTLLQIAGLLDIPTSGQVFINGIEASKANDFQRTNLRKENIGFIYQFHHLLPEFSVLENVAMPLLIQGKSKEEANEKAMEVLKMVDLQNRTTHKPSEISGGQQQRTAIARAIVAKPSLILADEPTGNLDSQNSQNVFDLLKDLAKSNKIACLVVTHNLELAKKCDRQIHIKDGKIAD